MNNILKPYLNKFVIVYLNNILIFSNTLKEHIKHLKMIFQKLQKNEFYAKPKKYNIKIEMIEFYEYKLEIKCVKFVAMKVNIIKN